MTTSGRSRMVVIGGLGLTLALVLTGCPWDKRNPIGLTGPGGGSGQSPIMVRGGSMSIFNFLPSGTDGTMACIPRTLNYIELDRVAILPIPTPPTPPTLVDVIFPTTTGTTYPAPSSNWEIDLTGRTWNGIGENEYFGGVRITPTNNCVTSSGTVRGVDVQIEPAAYQGSTNFGFYLAGGQVDGVTFSRMRYWNKSQIVTVAGPPPVSYVPAPSGVGDEDLSEMMFNIYVNDGSTGGTGNKAGVQAAKYQFRCVMAACDVLVGLN